MRKTFKIAISFALCFVMLLGTVAVGGEGFAEVLGAFSIKASAAETLTSGSCGNNVNYSFDSSTGTLTISGTGEMSDYSSYSLEVLPWYGSRSSISTVIIENGVTSIGSNTFRECSNLNSVIISNTVERIGYCAFCCCREIKSITIPNSVMWIDDNAFFYCESLTSIIIPSSIRSIGEYAFGCCFNLINVTIPGSVTCIGSYAFTHCTGLKTAGPIGGGYNYEFGWTDSIPNNAFHNCSGLTSITIPNSVTSIGDDAFYGCSSLEKISISNNVTKIGADAFHGCETLKSVSLSDNLSSMGSYVFCNCEALETVKLSKKYPNIPKSTFYGCTSLKTIYIPSRVSVININAFNNCSSLTDVYYEGSSKADINIDTTNSWLLSANWHYNAKMPDNNPSEKSDDPTPSYPDPVAGITETDAIKGNAANNQKTYDYKTAVTFNANVPEGGSVQWYVDDKPAGTNASLTVPAATKSYTVKVVVTDKNGGKTADTENVTIKSSFFDKLIYFFKHLFNPNAYIINQQ